MKYEELETVINKFIYRKVKSTNRTIYISIDHDYTFWLRDTSSEYLDSFYLKDMEDYSKERLLQFLNYIIELDMEKTIIDMGMYIQDDELFFISITDTYDMSYGSDFYLNNLSKNFNEARTKIMKNESFVPKKIIATYIDIDTNSHIGGYCE